MTQESKLRDKVAVVTGGSKGIGKALIEALVEQGAKVVIGDILVNEGEELARALNSERSDNVAVFVRTDVTSWDDNKKLFATAEKEFGGVDIACLNAGIAEQPETIFGPLEGESRSLNINLDGLIKGNRVAILHLAKRGGGVIVNTASVAGFVGTSLIPHYTASKHGVVGWTRSMQPMVDVANIRVNAVCPYWVETDILASINMPGVGFIAVAPKVPMKTVMDAYMTAILDESQHCKTIVALPDGVHVEPAFNIWASCVTEEMVQSKMVDYKEEVEAMKSGLKEARARANI